MDTLPRIWRSPYTNFGHDLSDLEDETVTANAVYTDSALAEIAAMGFDAIWVHGLLHHLVPSRQFPEFGIHAEAHLGNMRELMARAARHGVRVYLYMQPPRGFEFDDPFWKAHPQIQGAPMEWQTNQGRNTTYNAMCTSTSQVKEFLRESSETLGRELPQLGGVILITASEFPSHCFRNFNYADFSGEDSDGLAALGCPRCATRTPEDVIGEIVHLVRGGLKASNPEAQVIAWNWSWSFLETDPSPKIIDSMPDDVIMLIDFERGDSREILGKPRVIDEYSLSFAGPSQRFLQTYERARQRGLRIMAKLQLGTTHELATVPSLPLLGNLYEKALQMRRLKVEGFMGCWNFGNMPSANAAAFNEFFNSANLPERDLALKEFAVKYFGPCDADGALDAWLTFDLAMRNFPFSIPFIYMAPTNYALGYPLKPGPLKGLSAGRSWLDDERGDDLSACLDKPYALDEVISGLGMVSREWKTGATQLTRALEGCSSENARKEIANAWVCYHVWRSTVNTFLVYKLRERWTEGMRTSYLKIARDELSNVLDALPYVEADKRFGFHSEAHAHLFDAARMKKEVRALRKQLDSAHED